MDFAAFPQKFIDLLENCIEEANNDRPKYVAGISAFLFVT